MFYDQFTLDYRLVNRGIKSCKNCKHAIKIYDKFSYKTKKPRKFNKDLREVNEFVKCEKISEICMIKTEEPHVVVTHFAEICPFYEERKRGGVIWEF